MVNSVRVMTLKMSCRFWECGSFEQLLFFFFFFIWFVCFFAFVRLFFLGFFSKFITQHSVLVQVAEFFFFFSLL